MKKIIIFIGIMVIAFGLSGCSVIYPEYYKHNKTLSNASSYQIQIRNIYMNVDNDNRIIYISETSNANTLGSTKYVLDFSERTLYGYLKEDDWEKYKIEEDFAKTTDSDIVLEIYKICKDHFEETDNSMKCDTHILVSELPESIKEVMKEVLPDDEENFSVDFEMSYNKTTNMFTKVVIDYRRVYEEYIKNMIDPVFCPTINPGRLEIIFILDVDFSGVLPDEYIDKTDEKTTIEDFLEK